jgi:hypothetical protein
MATAEEQLQENTKDLEDLSRQVGMLPDPTGFGTVLRNIEQSPSTPPPAPAVNPLTARTPAVPGLTPPHFADPDIKRVEALIQSKTAEQETAEKTLNLEMERRGKEYDTEMKAAEAREQEATNAALATIEAEKARDKSLPMWKPEPVFSPQDVGAMVFQMIAMALVGGLRGSEGWQRAAAALDGTVQGYLAGSKEKMQMEWAEFQQQYRQAVDYQKAQQKEFEDTLHANELSINQKIRDISNIAARHGRDDLRYEQIMMNDIGTLGRQVTTLTDSLARMQLSRERIQFSYDNAAAHLAAANPEANLTAEAQQVMAEVNQMDPGNVNVRMISSRWQAKNMVPLMNIEVVNQIRKHPEWVDSQGVPDYHQIAAEMVQSGFVAKASYQAYAMNVKREGAVHRLTKSVHGIETIIMKMANQITASDVPVVNMTVNELTQRFGTAGAEDLQTLQTLMKTAGVQYMEAITMPGSQGQMHVGTQQVAEQMLNANMNVGQIIGTMKAWNIEIGQTTGALSDISRELIERVTKKEAELRKAGVVETYIDPVTGKPYIDPATGKTVVIDNSKPYDLTATWQQRLDDSTDTPSDTPTPAGMEHAGKVVPWNQPPDRK